jgi:hypothetical protein
VADLVLVRPMKRGIVSLLLVVSVALADDRFWRDERGNLAPNTEARSAVKGFGGWLLVTSDADWKQKWETSPDTVPRFAEAHMVARGKHVFVLTFFANAKLTDTGEADVTCDIDVIRPDGSSNVHQVGAVCFRGQLKGAPTNVYLSAPVVDFVGEPKDPAGKWLIQIALKDNIRDVSLSLRTSFTLVDEKA